jgi:nicotinamide-nucleotide amidase
MPVAFLTTEQKDITDDIARLLVERKETVGVAESSTGGLVSAALLSVSGASAYFLGGGVLYTIASRLKLVGMPESAFANYTGPSEERVALMAEAIRDRLGATWGIAESGVAGPTPSRFGHPNGHTVISVAGPVTRTEIVETGLSDRVANMEQFTTHVLRVLRDAIQQAGDNK